MTWTPVDTPIISQYNTRDFRLRCSCGREHRLYFLENDRPFTCACGVTYKTTSYGRLFRKDKGS